MVQVFSVLTMLVLVYYVRSSKCS